jgi:ParB-like chromosome segregation protein Spo0J
MMEEELQGLVEDIRENGQGEPVHLWHDGTLLDGRNRLEACNRLGIEPDICQFDSDAAINPVAYVLSHNLHRRHLSQSQKAMVAANLKEHYAAEAKERQKQGKEKLPDPSQAGQSRDKAAAAVGVSGKLVDAAAAVVFNGTPELVAAVTTGKVSVSHAATIAKLPKAEQATAKVKATNRKQHQAKKKATREKRKAEKQAIESPKARQCSLTAAIELLDVGFRDVVKVWPRELIAVMGEKLISLGEEIKETGGLDADRPSVCPQGGCHVPTSEGNEVYCEKCKEPLGDIT